ncbi:hypothetical protein N0B31_08835 [Salinirubellus salinus]|jgi:uncharacterized membrane protein (DUF485 family)|uniref:Uncharacterized protein n=1 Tax=Salinirubellus salinus TaxID=1364945 RepID=A0A9E7U9W6_9EURY|nr:hypothetical protein [Salinirubellus salinus]UWM56386.1 hypothetical protein N0B31_08835 [Salinirubellus salinus]
MRDDDYPDSVTAALLGESHYDRLRATRHGLFKQPIHTKLRWQSVLLFGLALLLPLMAVFPADVRALLPVTGAPKVVVLGLVGGTVVLVGGIVLTTVGVLRVRLEGRMTERQADTLLNVEEVASLLGIGTGGMGILLTLLFTSIGLGGVELVEAYVQTMGRSPFAATGVEWLSVNSVATLAFVGSVALFTASQYLRVELLVRLQNAVSD